MSEPPQWISKAEDLDGEIRRGKQTIEGVTLDTINYSGKQSQAE